MPKYTGFASKGKGQTWLHITAKPQFFTAEELVNKQTEEARRYQEQKERYALAKAKKEEQKISRNLEQWNEVARFRQNMKPSDKFQWRVPGSGLIAYGTVVRIDGDLVFVQFDNYREGGLPTKHLPKNDLEPVGARVSNSWGRIR